MLSGEEATRAGRTGERAIWQEVKVEHACCAPFWRSTVKVSVVVLPELGGVESTESGRTTRKLLEDSEKNEPGGNGVPFTRIAVVQMKLEPER